MVDPRIMEALNGPFGARPVGVTALQKRKGYADFPGTGPDGERCSTCANIRKHEFHSGRRISKCALTDSRSKTTDINSRSPACRRWEAQA